MFSASTDNSTVILTPSKSSRAMKLNDAAETIAAMKFAQGQKGSFVATDKGKNGSGDDSDRSLDAIMNSNELYPKFKTFLQYSFAEENILFLEAAAKYEKLLATGSSRAAVLKALHDVIDTYVRDTAEYQVNLSSDTRRSAVAKVESGTLSENELATVLVEARTEILTLVGRNFLTRFWRKHDQEQKSEALLKNLSGSYSKVWRLAGINGYQSAFNHLSKDTLDEVRSMKEYISDVINIAETQFGQYSELDKRHVFADTTADYTVTHAFNSFKTGFNLRRTMITSYLNNVRKQVLPRVDDLIRTMSSSLEEINVKYSPAINEMLKAKENLKEATEKAKITVREANASKGAQKFRRGRQTNTTKGKGKRGKKEEAVVDPVQKAKEAAATMVNNAEFELGMTESKHSEFMIQAMESLESLELYRLDKMRDILIRQSSAEQGEYPLFYWRDDTSINACYAIELLERFRLVLEPGLTDAVDADPVQEIVSIVSGFQETSMQGRPASIRRARS